MQDIIYLKYVTLLEKHKTNIKENNYQQRVWAKSYIKSFRLL